MTYSKRRSSTPLYPFFFFWRGAGVDMKAAWKFCKRRKKILHRRHFHALAITISNYSKTNGWICYFYKISPSQFTQIPMCDYPDPVHYQKFREPESHSWVPALSGGQSKKPPKQWSHDRLRLSLQGFFKNL